MSNKKIQDILLQYPEGINLSNDLKRIEKNATELLKNIPTSFPEFPGHDIEHSFRIINYFNELFPDSLKEKLNPWEIFFLISSSYLHDIGMVKTKDDEIIEPSEIQSHIRNNHHLRSEAFILKNYSQLGFEDSHQADIVGRICRGHRQEDLHDSNNFRSDKKYLTFSINIPLLSILLRISDEFDLSFNRTPEITYQHLEFKDKISDNEWKTHLSISGVGPQKDDPTVIVGSARCYNPIIHRKLKNIETKINEQLDELPDYLDQYWQIKKDLPKKFRFDIEAINYKSFDFKFSLKEREIFHLLMGEKLYSRKEESLRELLKNSIDACRSRQETLKKHGLSYNPSIEFRLTQNGNQLVISDNGIGMDEEIIENYFTKIGKSFYKSKEFFDQELKFTPVSELGIGILSAFMIADKLMIETKKENSQALRIEIDDISDYFFVTDSLKNDVGTIIKLNLKENSKKINFFEEIKKYACHVNIETIVISSSGEKKSFIDSGFEGLYTQTLLQYRNQFKLIGLEIKEKNIEGLVGFLIRIDENQNPILDEGKDGSSFSEADKTMNWNNKVSFEGIYVNDKEIIPSWLKPTFYDINIKNDSVDLNVARNDVVNNDKYQEFQEFLENAIVELFKNILDDLSKELPPIEKKKILTDFLNHYTDWYGYEYNLSQTNSKPNEKVIDLLRNYYYFQIISKDHEDLLNYYEMKKLSDKVSLPINCYNDLHLKEIISQMGSPYDKIQFLTHYNYKIFNLISGRGIVLGLDIFDLIGMQKITDSSGLFPKTWTIATFTEYKSSRFIEFSDYSSTIINADNRFVNLLLDHQDIITGDKKSKLALGGFFRNLKKESKKDFIAFIDNQKEILKWFVDKQIITNEDMPKYLLNKKDFPPNFF